MNEGELASQHSADTPRTAQAIQSHRRLLSHLIYELGEPRSAYTSELARTKGTRPVANGRTMRTGTNLSEMGAPIELKNESEERHDGVVGG